LTITKGPQSLQKFSKDTQCVRKISLSTPKTKEKGFQNASEGFRRNEPEHFERLLTIALALPKILEF